MVKRIFAVLAVVSMVAGLSACGVKGDLDYPGKKNVPGSHKSQNDSGNWVK